MHEMAKFHAMHFPEAHLEPKNPDSSYFYEHLDATDLAPLIMPVSQIWT